jgi:short-subunit dehydrogenase
MTLMSVNPIAAMADCPQIVAHTRTLRPPMVDHGHGSVLAVSSTAGSRPVPHFVPYAARKAAITSLGESVHLPRRIW